MSDEKIVVEGIVTEQMPNAMYRVQLDSGDSVLAYASGKVRRFKIKILAGDRVRLELSPYDLTKGRLVYRI